MAQNFSIKFYQSKQWRETRTAYLNSVHYICERCGGVADMVHHKKYLSPENMSDLNVALCWDNLEALCIDCHNFEHFGGGACADGLAFDAEGNMVRSGYDD